MEGFSGASSSAKKDDSSNTLTSAASPATTGRARPRLSVLRSHGPGKSRHHAAGDETPTPGPSRSMTAPQLVRRLSHPPHGFSSLRNEDEDGEFIKRAFDKLSVDPQDQKRKTSTEPVSLLDMLDTGLDADPLGIGATFQQVAARNQSKSSLASSPSATSYADRSSLHSSKPLLSRNTGSGRQPSNGTGRIELEGTPRLSDSNMSWTDPFEDTESRLRMRRRSTISGYSIGSSDWLSLRRGSLASLETGSNNGRSIGHAAENPFASPEVPTSTRWEQWAQAYRETMQQHAQPINPRNTSNDLPIPSTLARPPRPFRKISFTETLSSASSIHEQTNLFYPLRRQFIARPGSRSESNRILIVELCLALEEFHNALSRLWINRQAGFDPRTSVKRTSPPHPSLSDPRLPMLAAEVTSLITEIVEAVPSFSYALAQGNYGPIPFSMGNLAVKMEESSLDNYLERNSIINVPDGDTVSFDDWWPARLRLDLTDGLLADKAEDSPTLAMHGLNVFGSEDMSRVDSDSDRTDQLLAEGRRRWQEYKQGQNQGQ